MDGVLLYNPARIVRRPVVRFKHLFIPKREKTFLVPQSAIGRFIWRILHWSSIFVAPGYVDIKRMAKQGLIEPYVITARYDFLKPDFDHWMRKMNGKNIFKGMYMNSKNEQPHEYKVRLVQELGLDVFVEDNWDIVSYLDSHTDIKALWVYNIFDKNFEYKNKFSSLKEAVAKVRSLAEAHAKISTS